MSWIHFLWLVVAVSTHHLASAHPTRGTSSHVDKRASLLDTYRFNTVSTYTTLDQDNDAPPIATFKRNGNVENENAVVPYYVQAATSQVRDIVPNASFRIVDDYYVGTNNVGHVHFQQIIDGVDVDTAHFKVNVGCLTALKLPMFL